METTKHGICAQEIVTQAHTHKNAHLMMSLYPDTPKHVKKCNAKPINKLFQMENFTEHSDNFFPYGLYRFIKVSIFKTVRYLHYQV